MNNYFLLNRSIFDDELWLSEPFDKSRAWIDMIGNANYEDGMFFVRGNEVKVKRGELAWSERFMANRWKWSRDKVRGYMAYLSNRGKIIPQKNNIISLIKIINYDKYQTTDPTTEKPQTLPTLNTNKRRINNISNKLDNAKAGDVFVNKVMSEFTDRFGFNPTDKKPRYEAYNLVRRIKKFLKEIGREETEEKINKVISSYYNWLDKQDWFPNVQTMSVIRRKFEVYQDSYKNYLNKNV